MDNNNKNLNDKVNDENTAAKAASGSEIDERAVPESSIGEKFKEYIHSRRFKHGGFATVLVVFFIILMIILNIVSVMLVERVPALSPDLTSDKIYTLSDATLEILENLKYDVNIDILASEEDCKNPPSSVDMYGLIAKGNELIKRYAQYSDKVTINYVDLVSNPGYVNKYPEYSNVLSSYAVVVRTEKRTCVTSFYDMLPYLADGTDAATTAVNSLVETEMTTQIKTACLDTIPKVTFLAGNSNLDSSDLQAWLVTNGFDVKQIDLLVDEIPESDIAVLASPTTDLTENEIEKLEKFVSNNEELGKSLFVFLSPECPEMPNLSAFLEEWGIKDTRDEIYETDPSYYARIDYQNQFFAQYKDTVYSEGIEDLMAIAYSLDIQLLFEESGNYQTYPIVSTTTSGTTLPNTATFDPTKVSSDNLKERYIMVGSTKTGYDADGNAHQSNIFVSGCANSFSSDLLYSTAYGNKPFYFSMFNKLAGITEQTVDVTPKSLTEIDYTISSQTANIITAIFQFMIPGILVIIGFVIYLRRRHI